jgi:hypothetical protein
MNWKLIFQLSLFGLAMAILTVFVISATVEPIFWGVIFVACAFQIAARAPRWFFLHGFLVSLVNGVWITVVHVLLFNQYIMRHPDEAQMMADLHLSMSPRALMAVMGPIIAILSGLILGLFSFIAGRIFAWKFKKA